MTSATTGKHGPLYRALFEHTPDGVLLSRPDGAVLRANPAACEMLGWTEAELIALGRTGLVVDSPALRHMLAQREDEGRTAGELSLLCGDGTTLPVELTSALFTGEDGSALTCTIFRDIRERRQAAEATRERDYLLSESQRIAHIGTWDVTLPDGPLEWSDETYRLFGVERSFDLTQESFLSLVVADDRAAIEEEIRRSTGGEAPNPLDFRVTLPDGRLRVLQARGELRQKAAASPLRITGTVQDVTEQRQAEEALRQSVERHELAGRATFDAIWDLDLLTNVVSFNENFSTMFGHTASTQPGLMECVHPEDGPRLVAGFNAALTSGHETWTHECRVRRADGNHAVVRSRAYIVRDCEGRAVRVVGALDDVTEQRREQSERDRLIRAIEQAAEMVVITDKDGTIEYVNPAFERVTGYTRVELLGRNPRILQSGQHDREFYRTLWQTLGEGRTWHGRFINRRKSGKAYTEEASISPVRDRSEQIAGYVGVKRDITRDIETEARLAQSYRLEGLGRLAGGIAHDFNNLLTVILGYAGALLDTASDDDTRAQLVEIEQAGLRAATLTRQLLAVGRRQVLAPVPTDLSEVVRRLESMLARLLGEDVQLIVDAPAAPVVVDGDPGQLEQVLVNLAVNARDAMPDGGCISVTTAEVLFDAESAATHADIQPGPYAVLTVSDTGAGMDEATTARIFEPFFTTKEPHRGTGLGLATVYGIVRQSGGTVVVYSEPGLGSTFKVYLPLSTAQRPTSSALLHDDSTVDGGTETVLVVEDDDAVRRLAETILRLSGYTVLTSATAQDALELIEQTELRIDLVVTDIVMPGLGGRALAERLRKDHPGMRVLLMSGYAHDAMRRNWIADMGLRFVPKPLTRVSLLRGVRAMLDEAVSE